MMATEDEYAAAYGLLLSACERQEELSTAAGLCVMEAFNAFTQACAPKHQDLPLEAPSAINDLLNATVTELQALKRRESNLHRLLALMGAEALLRSAAVES